MSPEEIRKHIKALPLEERLKVVAFVRELKAPPEARYIPKEKFEESLDRVFTKHRELMRRLSQ